MRRRGRKRKQLFDFNEKWSTGIGRTPWRTRFGRICGEPVVIQTIGLTNLLMELNIVLSKTCDKFCVCFLSFLCLVLMMAK